jgi:two-component system sensor histidine kinase KdpD
VVDDKDLSVAKWALEHAELAGHGTDTLPGAACLCAPLRAAAPVGVLALWPLNSQPLDHDQRAFLDLFGRQVAVALERMQLSADARSAALRAKTEEMRSSLLSAVSHDLRTPLASITGAATSLRDDDNVPAATRRELVRSICDEAVRLERMVSNLLDMTRLESGAITLKRDWVPFDEIVGSALTRLEERLAARKLEIHLQPDLPLLLVDPVLIEQLLINLLENVLKYTPQSSAIEIRAERDSGRILIEVVDHGPGLPPASEERVFQKFYRGTHAGVPGAGLGLPICRGIAEAHGGEIRARNQPGGGAIFTISLPLGENPPSVSQPPGDVS